MAKVLDEKIEKLLSSCLRKLNQEDKFSEFSEYLRSEWYFRISDLALAIEDGHAWNDMKLPSRLKLELKSTIFALSEDISGSKWLKCYSEEHDAYYFYNTKTEETAWEIPEGDEYEVEDIDESSKEESKSREKTSNSYNHNNNYNNKCSPIGTIFLTDKLSEVVFDPSSIPPYPTIPELTNSEYSVANLDPMLKVKSNNNNSDEYESDSNSGSDEEDSSSDDGISKDIDTNLIQRLTEMGFSETAAIDALMKSKNNLSAAAAYLVSRDKKFGTPPKKGFSEFERRGNGNEFVPPESPLYTPPRATPVEHCVDNNWSRTSDISSHQAIIIPYTNPTSGTSTIICAEEVGGNINTISQPPVTNLFGNGNTISQPTPTFFNRPRTLPPPPDSFPPQVRQQPCEELKRPPPQVKTKSVIRRMGSAARNILSPRTEAVVQESTSTGEAGGV